MYSQNGHIRTSIVYLPALLELKLAKVARMEQHNIVPILLVCNNIHTTSHTQSPPQPVPCGLEGDRTDASRVVPHIPREHGAVFDFKLVKKLKVSQVCAGNTRVVVSMIVV